MKVKALLVAAFLVAAPSAPILAQPAAEPATALTLSATGEVSAPPDIATIVIGVDTVAPDAAQAMSQNAEQMNRIFAALRSAGVAERDLQTASVTLQPQYDFQQDKPPRLSGYQAGNQLMVTVRDLSALGRTVDAAVRAGATNMGEISFGFADAATLQDRARLAAVKALDAKAALYAAAAGYHVDHLVRLSEAEAESGSRPMPMMAMANARAATPVARGELKVEVTISGEFALTK